MFGLAVGLVALLALEFLFLLACAAREWPEAGVVSFIITVAVADLAFSTGIGQWVWQNPALIVGGFVAYLALGTGWSFFKWLTFLKRSANDAKDEIADIYKRFSLSGDLAHAAEILQQRRDQAYSQETEMRQDNMAYSKWPEPSSDALNYARRDLERLQEPPQASDNKRRITSWIATWPFSGLWFLIDEPIKFIWDWFRSSYQRLSDRMWQNVTASQG